MRWMEGRGGLGGVGAGNQSGIGLFLGEDVGQFLLETKTIGVDSHSFPNFGHEIPGSECSVVWVYCVVFRGKNEIVAIRIVGIIHGPPVAAGASSGSPPTGKSKTTDVIL